MTDPTANQSCDTCFYWLPNRAGGKAAIECHRMPPATMPFAVERELIDGRAAFLTPEQNYGSWPMTDPSDWCGEWKRHP